MTIKCITKKILSSNKVNFFQIILLSIFLSVIEVIAPYLNGKFIDKLVSQEKSSILLEIFAFIFLIEAVYIAFMYAYSIATEKLQSNCIFKFKMFVLEHLRRVPILEMQKYNPIYLNERINQDVTELSSVMINNFTNLIFRGLLFLVYITIVFSLNKEICYCLICVLPIYVIVYKKYQKQLYEISLQIKDKSNIYYQAFNEQFQMMETIKIDANFRNHNEYIARKYENYYCCLKKYTFLAAKFKTMEASVSLIIRMGILLLGIIYIQKGKMTIGSLVTITIYLNMLIGIVNYYISMAKTYKDLCASYHRIKKLLELEEEKYGNIEIKEILSIQAKISNRKVNCESKINKREFHGVRGKMYGISGENGIGKTTFLKQLIGISPLKKGDIIIVNKIKIEMLDMLCIRKNRIGFVSQKYMLTHKKVGEMFKEIIPDIHPINLSYYLMLKEIDYPFELVCDLWDKSYANISDGEKQIISILRILCKKNNVLILDEPFSNLDVLKKAWLVNMLKDIKKDKIIILISHDKEVLSHCDEIIRFS